MYFIRENKKFIIAEGMEERDWKQKIQHGGIER